MLVLNQGVPRGALSATTAAKCSSSSSFSAATTTRLTAASNTLFPRKPDFKPSHHRTDARRPSLTVAKADGGGGGPSAAPSTTRQSPPPPATYSPDDTVFVGPEDVPLEGVIQFDKAPSSSRIQKWGRIALLAGGDVLALLLFAAIGRFSHGFPVFEGETLRTADPFIAGWFLSAYFLGGYNEDGRGMNGFSKAVLAATKSWALGVPIGLGIRALSLGHLPPTNFISVTLGSTAVLLIGWRSLLFKVLPGDQCKKDDMYRRGSPFELFELLTSLVRRW